MKIYNNKVFAVHFEQSGKWNQEVEVSVKLGDTKLNTKSLYFYAYDAKTNTYKRFEPKYWIDKNGYLHFNTEFAGDIIITDSPLTKK